MARAWRAGRSSSGNLNWMKLSESWVSWSKRYSAPYLFLRNFWYSEEKELSLRMSAHCPVERTLFEARLTRDYLAKLLKIRVIDPKRDSSSP